MSLQTKWIKNLKMPFCQVCKAMTARMAGSLAANH